MQDDIFNPKYIHTFVVFLFLEIKNNLTTRPNLNVYMHTYVGRESASAFFFRYPPFCLLLIPHYRGSVLQNVFLNMYPNITFVTLW